VLLRQLGTDFGLQLFGPHATDVTRTSLGILEQGGDGPRVLMFTAPSTASYYLDVFQTPGTAMAPSISTSTS